MSAIELCSECPWPGKCNADEVCWLEVEWQDDEPEDAEDEDE